MNNFEKTSIWLINLVKTIDILFFKAKILSPQLIKFSEILLNHLVIRRVYQLYLKSFFSTKL